MTATYKISIIVPCYFNAQNLPSTFFQLRNIEKSINDVEFEYLFVDDGSKDSTYEEILKLKNEYPNKVLAIKLSGNFGSYNAILAGMNYSTGDCCVVISADLQDPPDLIPKMFNYWKSGIKLVLANRVNRNDGWISDMFSSMYHWTIRKYALPNMPKGGFDFCLFDASLRNSVVNIDEKNTNTLFLLLWLKYDFISIPYERKKREIGKSKWTLKKKIKLLIDSFISFSYYPIKLISIVGLFLATLAVFYSCYIIYLKFSGNIKIEGWTTLMLIILFVSSFQMLAIAIIGEYLWRSLDATRKRPNYVIEKVEK